MARAALRPASRRGGAASALARDERGVSDVVGSILMVAITVVVMAGLALLILSIDGPADEDRADLSLLASPGAGGWGTGDELLTVTHQGGETLHSSDVEIVTIVNGVVTRIPASSLAGPWADGSLTIGESWTQTMMILADDRLEVQVLHVGSDNRIIATGVLRGGEGVLDCAGDTTPPFVSTWIKTPLDLDDESTGAVTVTAHLSDDCSGPDPAVAPHLEHRFFAGAWTDVGAMTMTAPARWTATVPDQGWVLHAGETFEVRLTNLTDRAGNTGTSAVHSDLIQILDQYTIPSGVTMNAGTVTDFANVQAVDGLLATFSQITPVATRYGTLANGNGVADFAQASGGPDDLWASVGDHGDWVSVSGFSSAGMSGTITQVELMIQSNFLIAPVNDDLTLSFRVGTSGGFTTAASDYVPSLRGIPPLTPADEEAAFDITVYRAWTWSDIQNLHLRVDYERSGSSDLAVFYVDALWVRVTTAGAAATLDAEIQFPIIAGASLGELQIAYLATGDTFHVDVWDGTTWNTRGALTSSSLTSFTYTLTLAEKTALGGAKIRLLDDTPGSGTGDLLVDAIRVVNA